MCWIRSRIGVLVVGLTIATLIATSLLAFLFRPSSPIAISKETTRLTEPLGPDGLPDYGQALLTVERANCQGKENGAIPFWQALGLSELSAEQLKVLESELGSVLVGASDEIEQLDALSLQEDIVNWLAASWAATGDVPDDTARDAPVAHAWDEAQRVVDAALRQPWHDESIPPLGAWLNRTSYGLHLLREAASKPCFYSPSTSFLEKPPKPFLATDVSHANSSRKAVKMLIVSAFHAAGNGDFETAWRDTWAAYGLARAIPRGTFLVQDICALSCYTMACRTTQRLVQDPQIPRAQLAAILNDLQDIPARNTTAQAIDTGERYLLLDTIIRTSRGEIVDADVESVRRFTRFGLDWNTTLARANAWFDRLTEAAQTLSWADRSHKLRMLDRELANLPEEINKRMIGAALNRKARSEQVADLFILLLTPAIQAAADAEERLNGELELTRINVALAMYRADTGGYPASLDELVPSIIPHVPVDRFHAKTYMYQVSKGGYLLYSFGANGQDDNGNSTVLKRLHGCEIADDGRAPQVRDLLRDELTLELNGYHGTHEVRSHDLDQLDARALADLIPPGADDIALRVPIPVIPMPRSRSYENE